MTIVIVTHEMTSAFRIADRLAMLYPRFPDPQWKTKASFQASTDPRIGNFSIAFPNTSRRVSPCNSAGCGNSPGLQEHKE